MGKEGSLLPRQKLRKLALKKSWVLQKLLTIYLVPIFADYEKWH